MKLPEELKNAVSELPSKEKDKLIFRLLRKDPALADRLFFELVSDKSVEELREEMKAALTVRIEQVSVGFYSTGYLNMDVRYMSGDINKHVAVAKDKFGEIQLNLFLLNNILAKNRENILRESFQQNRKFCDAVVARAFKIMLLTKKVHEDYFIDFKEDIMELGSHISDNDFIMRSAIYNGLDVNWLLKGDIPDNIVDIYKGLRERGYL